MTNREMVLFAAAIFFAATTAGLAFRAFCPMQMGPHMGGWHQSHHKGGKQHWKDRKEQMFLKADTDKDGALSKQEMHAGITARVDGMFTKMDKDGDGKLTREEMEAGRKAMKKRFLQNPEKAPDLGPDARRPQANQLPA